MNSKFVSQCIDHLMNTNNDTTEINVISTKNEFLNCITDTWLGDFDFPIPAQAIAESTKLIQIALSLDSVESVELLENLILLYSHYKEDRVIHEPIVRGIHELHIKWIELYAKQQQINIDNNQSQYEVYCNIERILTAAYLAMDDAYEWLKDDHNSDIYVKQLQTEMIQFNVSMLSNKIHSFEIANMALNFFDNFGDNSILHTDVSFFSNFIHLLVNACSISNLSYLNDFNYQGVDEIEAFSLFRSHARETMFIIASSWDNANVIKCMQVVVSLLNNTNSVELAESVFWLLRDLDDACNTIDGDEDGDDDYTVEDTMQLWAKLYKGILSLPSFQQPITLLQSVYQLIEKNNDSVIYHLDATTLLQQLIEFLLQELYHKPHQSIQLDCARTLYSILSNVKISKKINQHCNKTFIHNIVKYFIEKENSNDRSNNVQLGDASVRKYVYCSVVSLLKYHYSNVENQSIPESVDNCIVIQYLKCICVSIYHRLSTITNSVGKCNDAATLSFSNVVGLFTVEITLMNDVLDAMSFDVDMIDDDNIASYNSNKSDSNIMLVHKMECLYTHHILDDILLSVVDLVSSNAVISENEVCMRKIETFLLKFYLNIIKTSGMAIFQLKTLEILFANAIKVFNDNHCSNSATNSTYLEILNRILKAIIENYVNMLQFQKQDVNSNASSDAIMIRVYEFIWVINSFLMPTLSNCIVQYQQQCTTSTAAVATMQLLPSIDTYFTFLNTIDEITTIPVTKLISSQFDLVKSNTMLFNGLDLSLFLLEHVCVSCKSRYRRLQRDQIGRRVLNSYMHAFEYYIQCNISNSTINLNELNNKLEIALSKLLHATIWKELSVILKNNVARFVHTICNSDVVIYV
eukprot:g1220.t1